MNQLIYAQEQVLARIIRDNKIYFESQTKLHKEVFPAQEYQTIFAAFLRVIAKGNKADMISISREMESPSAFRELAYIVSKADFQSDINQSIDFVYNESRLDNLRKLLLRVNTEITQGSDADTIITMIQKEIIQAESRKDKNIKTMADQLEGLFEHANNNSHKKGISGIPTGFDKIDAFTGGIQLTDLFIIAGATSMGKTTLSLSIAKNAALSGIPVAVVSLEMSELQLAARLAAMESKMSSKLILTSVLEGDRIEWLRGQTKKLAASNLYIDDIPTTNLDYILGMMRKYIIQKNVKLFVLDYLQLIRMNVKGMSREERIAEISRILKNFAKETNTAIILLSQMNRAKDGRSSPEPQLSDLRGSGEIEETADVVAFCYRPEVYSIGEFSSEQGGGYTQGKALFIIAKGRNIGTGTIKMDFSADIPIFTSEAYAL